MSHLVLVRTSGPGIPSLSRLPQIASAICLLVFGSCGHDDPTAPANKPPSGTTPTLEIAQTDASGTTRFTKLSMDLTALDGITGDPILGLTAIAVLDSVGFSTLVLDTGSRYHATADFAARTSLSNQVELLPRDMLGDVVSTIGSGSTQGWIHLLDQAATLHIMPLGQTYDFVDNFLELALAGFGEKFTLALLPQNLAGLTTAKITLTTITTAKALHMLWGIVVIERFKDQGYIDSDLFEVGVLQGIGMISLRPVGEPQFPPASRAVLRVAVVDNSSGQSLGLFGRISVDGPSPAQGTTFGGELVLTNRIPGSYTITAWSNGYYPWVAHVELPEGGDVLVEIRLSYLRPHEPVLIANTVGGTYHAPRGYHKTGTMMLAVFGNGDGVDGQISLAAGLTWNRGVPWVMTVDKIKRGSWKWNVLHGVSPSLARYDVTVQDERGRVGRTSFSIRTTEVMGAPSSVSVLSYGPSVVDVSWSPVPGVAAFVVNVYDALACVNYVCPAIRPNKVVPPSETRTLLEDVPFEPGGSYFVGVWAFNTNILIEPPPLPAQLNIGYIPSGVFRPLTAPGASTHAPALVGPGERFGWASAPLSEKR